jgi:predicted nucleic acid-binding protein
MRNYIFDTTAISNFAVLNSLDLLQENYKNIAFTTIEVADELRRGYNAGYSYLEYVLAQINTAIPDGWLQILYPTSFTEHQLRAEFDSFLDSGEASCLALAVSHQLVLVTDDLAARRLAEQKNVPLTGTLGILIKLVRTGRLSLNDANDMLRLLIRNKYRSPVERFEKKGNYGDPSCNPLFGLTEHLESYIQEGWTIKEFKTLGGVGGCLSGWVIVLLEKPPYS